MADPAAFGGTGGPGRTAGSSPSPVRSGYRTR